MGSWCADAIGASNMPRKSRKTEVKDEATETRNAQQPREAKEHPSASSIVDELMKQQVRVLDEVSTSIAAQQKVCGEILHRWLGFSAETYRNMTKVATEGGKKYSGIYDLWNEYYERLNARMLEVARKNTDEYTEAVGRWKDITTILNELFVTGPEKIEETQRKYAEFSDYLSKKAAEAGEGALSDFTGIQTLWLEFTEKIGKLTGDLATEDEMYRALMGPWETAVTQMTNDISTFVDSSSEEYRKYLELWDEIFSTTANTMMGTAKSFFRSKERE